MGGARGHWAAVQALLGRRAALLSRWQVGLAGVVFTLLIGLADYKSGAEISLALAYVAPIAMVAWLADAATAFAVSALCVAVWVAGDYAAGVVVSSYWVTVANCSLRLMFYGFLILVLTQFKHLHRNLERLAGQRAVALAQEIAERQKLERAMLEISEREQRRIGQDLHDSLCQHLTGTALAAQALVERLEGRGDPEGLQARKIVDLLEDSISLARGMAKGLYPVEMQADGLMQALEEFASATSELFKVRCRFECQVPVLIHVPAAATHLFRIAQEAVSNAIKHGRAGDIVIVLEENDDGVRLAVCDNGAGLPDPLPSHRGMGLRIMADRARMIGGQFASHRGKARGTEIDCRVPQKALEQAHA